MSVRHSRTLFALLLAWALAATLVVTGPTTASANPVTHSKTLTPLPGGNNVISQLGINRGRLMMRESLGITVSAGAVIEARVTNGVGDVVFTLTTDDHQQDVQQTLPTNGNWLTVTAKKASVVFVRSRQWATAPNVEYRVVSGTEYVTPEYNRGDSQADFVSEWTAGNSPFSLIVDQAFTMLIPRVDLPKVQNMGWSQFDDLNAVIDSYRHVIGSYNEWMGIDDNHSNPVHHDLPQAYFVRPDISGPGLAYYGPHNAVGTNNNSVSYYLDGPGSWLILHELGHGYDGMMTSGNGPADMHLGEVWNNVYAYQYQAGVLGHQSNWLYNNGRAAGQKAFDDVRRNNGGRDFQNINVRERLDVLARIAELTGTEGFARFNQGLREYRADPAFSEWPSRVDLIADRWGRANGYDILPWLEQFGLSASPGIESRIRDQKPLPAVLPLGDYFSNYATATTVANSLGLASPGQLVATPDLQNLGYAGRLTATATISNAANVEGRSATLWTGTQLVGQAAFRSGVADFGNVPIGSYTVRFPEDAARGTVPQRQSVKISQDQTTTIQADYPATTVGGSVNGTRFVLRGLGNGVFAEVVHNPENGTLTVVDGRGAPHTYFSDEYAHITISANSQTLFDRSFVGTAGRPSLPAVTTVPATPGTTVSIRHREWPSRLLEQDPLTGADKPSLNATTETTQYTVTTHGLQKVGSTVTAEADYIPALQGAITRLRDNAIANPGARLEAAAAKLRQDIDLLSDAAQRATFQSTHGVALSGLIRPAQQQLVPVTLASPLASQPNQASSRLFDGNLNTEFHSPWDATVTFPYHIDLSLGANPVELSSLVLVPHQNQTAGSSNGRPGQYRVLVGNDVNSLTQAAAGTWADDTTAKLVRLQGTAKFVRLEILSTYGAPAMRYVAARELQVFGKDPAGLTVKMSRTDTIAAPKAGDVLTFRVDYTNNRSSTATVFPRSSNLNQALTTGSPNCRYINLAAGVTNSCTSARVTVTEADVRNGSITPVIVFDATADGPGNNVLESGFVATTGPVVIG